MIDAYLDETGIHDGAPICLICGFFGGRGQWRRVADAWLRTLKTFDVPPEEFHANAAVNRQKFFSGWDDERHEEFLMGLANSLAGFKVYPISYGIVVSAFEALSEKQRRFFTGMEVTPEYKTKGTGNPNKPYFTIFFHIVRAVASYAEVGGRVNFFFGVNSSFAGYAQEMFDKLKSEAEAGNRRNYRERLGEISFPRAKETPQLQAADFFAYLNYDHSRRCLQNGNWHVRPVPALELLAGRARSANDDLIFYNEETIAATLAACIPDEVKNCLK